MYLQHSGEILDVASLQFLACSQAEDCILNSGDSLFKHFNSKLITNFLIFHNSYFN